MFHQLSRNCLNNLSRSNIDICRIFHLKCRDLALHSLSARYSSTFLQRDESHTEKSFFTKISDKKDVKAKGDPDRFGTLSKQFKVEKEMDSMPDEEDDIVRKTYVDNKIGRTRLSTKQYADSIKKHLANKKLNEAIDVLEVQMIKEDRVQPENYIYNLLIDGCAKAGYSKMAFKLYNDMKKRDLKVTGATYTSLFNACALSPIPGDGLKRARHLQQLIIERGVQLNRSNYHSMMKAFGRCGDLVAVFNIVDEMASKGVPLQPITFCFLLQACISDKTNGFRHAIMVWRKMRERGVKPTIYCYNLMLRCVRDCQLEDPVKLVQDLCLTSPNNQQSEIKLLEAGVENNSNSIVNVDDVMHVPAILPNLLSAKPQMGTVVSLRPIIKPKDRLMLLGGGEGFLKQMQLDAVEPNIVTAILLIDVIPSTNKAELELIESLEKSKMTLHIDFFNTLIRKRCMRQDHLSAKEVLPLLTKHKLTPNLMTFGVLSMACRSSKETRQFLEDLRSADFRPNMEILGGLLCAARHSWNVNIIILIMDIVVKEEIKVSELFMKHLNKFKEVTERQIELKQSKKMPYNKKIDNKQFMNSYKKFLAKYTMWLKVVDMDDRDTLHPWKQYKKPVSESNRYIMKEEANL